MDKTLSDLLSEVREAWRPKKALKLSEWADKHAFLSAESAAEPGRWTTLPYQREPMDAMTDPEVELVAFPKSARVGYALDLRTPIRTIEGWKTMGTIEIGDTVFDENGNPCRVQYVSPIYTDHECFLIDFCDGSQVVADKGHKWYVESDNTFEYLLGDLNGRNGKTGRLPANQVSRKNGIMDTGEISVAYKTVRGRNTLAIPVANPLDFPELDLPIPPYTLGLWLGDGNSASPRITCHRDDVGVADYIRAEGIDASVRFIDSRYPNNATIFLDVKENGKPISPWAKILTKNGLMKNKHIPQIYLNASVSQRLALLRGLMDSDGTINENGFAEFCNTKSSLAFGVFELAVSLGMKATIKSRKTKQEAHHIQQYRVVFKCNPGMIPFSLKRKAERVKPLHKPSISLRRRIVSVKKVASVPVRCIQVSSKSNLFLCGKSMIPTHNTKMINNLIGYHIHQDPCPIMVVQPTESDAVGYSKDEIAPMIRDTPVLSGLVSEPRAKDSNNTLQSKAFPGGVLQIIGANSPGGFRRVSRRVVLFDETDGYPPSAGKEGDQIKLGIKRTEYYWNRKIVAGSTPTEKPSRIETLFHQTDQRRFFVPCPQCGEFQYLKWGGPEASFGIKWPEGKPQEAFYCCEHNGCLIEHTDKFEMVEKGEWRATAEAERPGWRGYHIWAAYSFSPNATWGQLAQEFLEAKDDPNKLKTFVNTTLGEAWEEKTEKLDPTGLMKRTEPYEDKHLPDGVLMLVAGVDVQADRIELEILGIGEGEETWSIDYVVLSGDPLQGLVWQMLDSHLLHRVFIHSTGMQMKIARSFVDSGDGNRTYAVYDYTKPREALGVYACKGMGTQGKLLATQSSAKNGEGYKQTLYIVGTYTAKDLVYGRLNIVNHGPGYCHFPTRYGVDYFKQLVSEEKKTRYTKGFPIKEWWKPDGVRNEALDCRVYAMAAFASLGISIDLVAQAMRNPDMIEQKVRGVRS